MNIFDKTQIGTITVKNRIIRSATHEGLGDERGFPMDGLLSIYTRLAEGDAGAIITGYVSVEKNGRTVKNMRMFHTDEYIDAYRKMNESIAELGTPLVLQIAHAGAMTTPKVTGEEAVAPSAFKSVLYGQNAREMTEYEIDRTIDHFVKAVIRAKKAGFAAVQLHAAHGYLLSQFQNPQINRRRDRWGGPLENRFRIIREIVDRSREATGNYPIWAKISAYDDDRRGLRIDDGVRIAEMMQKTGIDAIEVSCGGVTSFTATRSHKQPIDAMLAYIPWIKNKSPFQKRLAGIMAKLMMKNYKPVHNYNVAAAERIKKSVDIPVIVVGGIRKLPDIEEIIQSKKADFVSLCRPFIIEPDIVKKFRTGKQLESRCIDCSYCLMGITSNPLRCYYGKVR